MLRVLLDEQKHERGRDRETEDLCAVIHTEEHWRCLLHASFLSQASTSYKIYKKKLSHRDTSSGALCFEKPHVLPLPSVTEGTSHVEAGTHCLAVLCKMKVHLLPEQQPEHFPLPTRELKNA